MRMNIDRILDRITPNSSKQLSTQEKDNLAVYFQLAIRSRK